MDRVESDELKQLQTNEPFEARWPRFASIGLAAFAIAGGLISFLGWLANIPRLTDWDGSAISIQPNTTVTAIAAGSALLLCSFGYRNVAACLAAFVGVVGFTALLQNVSHTDFGINTFLTFGHEWGRGGLNIPGLMGFPGSVSWTLLGTTLLLLSIFSRREHPKDFGPARTAALTLAAIALVISSLSLIGYVYGAKALYAITAYTAIAAQTALFIFALSLGIIFSIRESGPMRLFSDPGPAGILTRRLVPPLIILPILIGAIRLIGEKAGFYDLAFGSAMRTVTEIGLLLTIVWWAGAAINRQAKRAEETQNDLQRLADAMPQVVWMANNSGIVEYYNERAAELTGIFQNHEGKWEWQPGVHPDDLESTLKSWTDAVNKGAVYTHEHRIQMADGNFRWHLSRAIPTPGSNGNDQKWFGTATDIHDLKTAEYALRESEQRFARFMQNLPGLAWIKDKEGRYVFANEAAQIAFGKTGAELYGKTDLEIFDPETAAGFVENDRLAFETPTGRQTVEALKDDNGNIRYSLVNKFPIHVNGEPSLVGGMAIDITEQKIAQDNQDFLFRVADKIRMARNAEDLLAEISEELGSFLGLHRCLFNEIDVENDLEIVHRDFTRTDESVAGRHKISDYSTVNSLAMAGGNTIVNRDSKNDPRTADYFEKTYGPNKELAYVAVPMLRESRWVASLWCSDDRPRDWTSHEITLIEDIAERAWAAVERLRSEVVASKLAAIVQSSDDAIISKDLNGIITSWNRGAEKIFGYTESEVVGKSITILIPPHRLDEEPGILERIRRGESIDHYETVRRKKDGTMLDISITVSPIFDAQGQAIGASKVARDITARKEAERKLRETTDMALAATAKFESVFNQSGIFAGILDREGYMREANDLALEVCGYSRDEVLNKPFWETGWWHGSDEVKAKMKAAIEKAASGERYREILPYWWADGTERVVDFAMHPVRDANGNVILLHPTGIDITDRIKAEEEIRMISRMPEENPNPVLRITPAGEILYANPTARPLIEYWDKMFGESIPEDFRWCVSEAFETNSKQTIDIVYDDRFLSCNLAPIAEAGYVNVYADDVTERQRAEEALRISEERYRALIELSPQFVFMSRPDGHITYVNQFVLDFSGKQYEEMIGTGWTECIQPEFRDAEFRKWSAAVESGDDYESDFPFLYSDGTYRTVFARAQPVRDEEGRIVYWIGTALDIEDRKQAQERLRASETQLRLVTDAIPALVSYIDRYECYQFVNKQYSDWFGKPREDFLGKKMRDVLGARAYTVVKPYVSEALGGNEVSFDSWLSYKGAGQRYVHVSYVPDRSGDGTIIGLFALVSDLSELKRSEDLLRASQERMQLMTDSFTDYAIMSTDVEGRIDSWNPGAEAIFGYSEDEIMGQPSEILFTPEDVVKGIPLKEMRDARRHGRATDERWHVRKDGSRFFADGAMVPLYVGRVLSGYAKIAADLTERKRNAEALQRAHDEMEIRVLERTRELAEANAALRAEIAERKAAEEQTIALLKRLVTSQEDERRRIARDLHDQLGQRLTALRLKIASLREMVVGDPELKARTDRLQQIGELLDSEVSFLAWELRPSAIEELGLTDAIGTFAREWSRHYGIPAEFHSMAMGQVALDPEADTHLYRIAQEALNNIVKHANAKKVNILLEHTDGEVILIVEDDGKGFDRQESKRTRKSGKGLGLTGMEERASLIGGAVEIESSPGSGTTIFARIPLRTQDSN